jgi:hypothetical protein
MAEVNFEINASILWHPIWADSLPQVNLWRSIHFTLDILSDDAIRASPKRMAIQGISNKYM